jgi:transposase
MSVTPRTQVSGMELRRYRVIVDLMDRRLSQDEAASALGLSTRQVRRLVDRVGKMGLDGVVHGLVGKPSNHRVAPELEQRVIELWEAKYKAADPNFTHLTQMLNEREGLEISKEKIRTLLRSKGLVQRKPKKGRKHRKARPRRERFGELVQLDTSPHDWLGTGQELHAVVAVDDATSRLLYLRLYEHDGTLPNLHAIRSIVLEYGLFMSLYVDGAAWFVVTRHWDGTAVGRATTDYCTQIQRALDELGIELIVAGSPQAKGRVERANGTLQDRLITELRLRNIQSLDQANDYIGSEFIADYNRRFAKTPQDPEQAFLPFVHRDRLDRILCLRFHSQVQNDNTVSKAGRYKLQMLPIPSRLSWAKAPVEVYLMLDGSAEVRHATSNQIIPHEVLRLEFAKEFKHPKARPSKADIFILPKEDISI